MLAILLLPRQFQVAVVENVDEKHLGKAMWLFPLYLLAINVFVLPIAFGGLLHFPAGSVDADTFVLTLPMAERWEALALLVFIGGLSAATGMVIVETIALSTMVCNDLVMPVLLRWRALGLQEARDLSGLLLGIRRGAIVFILLLGYLYFRLAGEAYALVSIGLISFAAVAQFAPALLGGLFWKGGTRAGALAGMSAGFAVWFYTLLLPVIREVGMDPHVAARGRAVRHRPAEAAPALRPRRPRPDHPRHDLEHALQHRRLRRASRCSGGQGVEEHRQASLFVDVARPRRRAREWARLWRGTASVPAIWRSCSAASSGPGRAQEAFAAYARERGLPSAETLKADAELVHFAETQLAGAIGAASARAMVASVVEEEPIGLDEVMSILDEASQVIAYSHQLEQKSRELEAATAELRAANERLQELDRLKDDFISTVTHELRTPLTSIRAFSEILRDNPGPRRRRALALPRHRDQGVRAPDPPHQPGARPRQDRVGQARSGTPAEVDLREVIEESVTATSQLYRDRGIALEARAAGRPCRPSWPTATA